MLQNCSTWEVARVFFDEPTKDHYLREISKKSGLAHTSVKKHLEDLIEYGIIEEEELKRGKRTYPIYKRKDGEVYKRYKKIDILDRLHRSGLIEHLVNTFYPDSIVLFGSSARGEDIEGSDLDIFIQATDKEIELSEYETSLHRKIQLHVEDDLQNYPKELKNNIANGIVVHGYLEVQK